MFIKRTTLVSDLEQITQQFQSILAQTSWSYISQIGLNHRPGAQNIWHDASGSLYDYTTNTFKGVETDFINWNIPLDSYLYQQIQILSVQENINIGRVRFMRLHSKTGLSVHHDNEYRYHLVIQTNPRAYIAENIVADRIDTGNDVPPTAVCYHLPRDSTWYKVDTRRTHWVYNGGSQERIHLVVCGLPK